MPPLHIASCLITKTTFPFAVILRALHGSGSVVDLASNINEYQESFWGREGGKARPARKTDNLAAICELIV
jgi:hypothetical protein